MDENRNSLVGFKEVPREQWSKIEIGAHLKYRRVAGTIAKPGKLKDTDLRECYFRGIDREGNLLMKTEGGTRKWALAPAKIERIFVSQVSSPEVKLQKILKRVNAMHAFMISKYGEEYKRAIAARENQ